MPKVWRPRNLIWTKSNAQKDISSSHSSSIPRSTYSSTNQWHPYQREKQFDVVRSIPHSDYSVTGELEQFHLALSNESDTRSCVGSVVSCTEKGRTDTSAKDYHLGDVVYIPHVISSLDPSSMLGDNHVGWIENTGPVVGKMRPAIVVAIYRHSMICIPMWTSQGRGFSQAEAEHCIWIREWDDDDKVWNGVSEYQYLMLEPPTSGAPGSYVNLAKPFAVSYQFPMTRTGNLTHKSWLRLHRLWNVALEKGLLPVQDQQVYADQEARKIAYTNEYEEVRREQLELLREAMEAPATGVVE